MLKTKEYMTRLQHIGDGVDQGWMSQNAQKMRTDATSRGHCSHQSLRYCTSLPCRLARQYMCLHFSCHQVTSLACGVCSRLRQGASAKTVPGLKAARACQVSLVMSPKRWSEKVVGLFYTQQIESYPSVHLSDVLRAAKSTTFFAGFLDSPTNRIFSCTYSLHEMIARSSQHS